METTVAEVTSTSSETPAPVYRYRDRQLRVIWQTSVPKDDEAALAYFHVVTRFGPDFKPVYCEAITRDDDGEHYRTLREVFDPEAMECRPFEVTL